MPWGTLGDGNKLRGMALVFAIGLAPVFVMARAGALGTRLTALVNRWQKGLVSVPELHPASPFSPRIDAHGRVQVYIHPATPGGPLPPSSEIAALGAVRIRASKPLDLL